MQRDDAVRALEIYKKSGSQVYVVIYTLILWLNVGDRDLTSNLYDALGREVI
jgi:hypothetical protein